LLRLGARAEDGDHSRYSHHRTEKEEAPADGQTLVGSRKEVKGREQDDTVPPRRMIIALWANRPIDDPPNDRQESRTAVIE
jgi:hypothetical protein